MELLRFSPLVSGEVIVTEVHHIKTRGAGGSFSPLVSGEVIVTD